MKRNIDGYISCDPKAMAHNQSDNAKQFAFEDMKADIIELYNENARLRNMMRIIAYPKRGTVEEFYSIIDIAELIQSAYTAEHLSDGN